MNNQLLSALLVLSGAVIALAGVGFGVWISARFTGAFTTVSPAEEFAPYGPADTDWDANPVDPERVPWEDPTVDPLLDPGADPANYTEA